MNVVEIIMLLIVLATAVDGVRTGLVRTAFSIVRMIIGVVVAYFICFWINGSVPESISGAIPIVFLIIIGIVLGVLRAVENLLNVVEKIPIARTANRVAGFAAGLLKGIVLIWILFYTASYFTDTEWGLSLYKMINESDILRVINSYNPIFYGFDGTKINIVFA